MKLIETCVSTGFKFMADKIQIFNKKNLKFNVPQIKSGMNVRVLQKIKEGDKERLQAFEGVVIAVKHGRGKTGAFTVRKISGNIGVERVFPFHTPTIDKVEILSRAKVRRAKLYYLRSLVGKRAKMKQIELVKAVVQGKETAPVIEEAPAS